MSPEEELAARLAAYKAELGGRVPAQRQPVEQEQAEQEPTGPRHLVVHSAATMRMRSPRWLWQGRIPASAISLLAGREGIGKSTITYDLVGRVTRGKLPGKFEGQERGVVVVATEDAWEEVILPRLVAAGADLGRVFRVDAIQEGNQTTISVPADLRALRGVCTTQEVALVVLDPLMSVIHGGIDTHKDREVRGALDPLARFAVDCGVSVLGLIHTNKSNTADPLNSIMASRAFTAAARSVLYCLADPEAEGDDQYLFGHPKCNLGPRQPTIGYRLAEVRIDLPDPPEGEEPFITTSRVVWGEEDARSIREAMEAPPAQRPQGDLAIKIEKWVREQGHTVSGGDIAAQFGEIKRATLDMNLSRMVKRGVLRRPANGLYAVQDQPTGVRESNTPPTPSEALEVLEVSERRRSTNTPNNSNGLTGTGTLLVDQELSLFDGWDGAEPTPENDY